MTPQRVFIAGLFTTGLLLAGCGAALSVSSHLDRTQDFSAYRTYDWGPADAFPAGDPRLDRDPLFNDRLQGAFEKRLTAAGLRLVTGERPDLLVHYHANVVERIDIDAVDAARGHAPAEGAPPVLRYEAGTIVLDVIDARTNTLVWRGWAQTRLNELLGDPERAQHVIDEAATRMMQRFPISQAGTQGLKSR